MKKGDKLYDLVYQLLISNPETRGSDKLLMWRVWYQLGYIQIDGRFGEILTAKDLFNPDCPTPESVTRCRRKIQELHPEVQAANRTRAARAAKAEEKGTHIFRERARAKGEPCPVCPAGVMVLRHDYDWSTGVAVETSTYKQCNKCKWRTLAI